jgi:ABC-type amino acid transport system permease subunit
MISVLSDFLPVLAAGFAVNLQIAAAATAISLAFGLSLAMLRHSVPGSRRPIHILVRLMQAAPTYAIMFFALNALPRNMVLFGVQMTGLVAVVLAQSVYLTSYVEENGHQAIECLARDEFEQALLFIPNLLRGFIVVVMSSGFAAAIGVSEAVSVTIRQAERLHALADRVLLFLVVMALFSAFFAVLQWLIRRLVAKLARAASSFGPETTSEA